MQHRHRVVDIRRVTLPRPVYPGERTMAQKQCHGQQFRLRPDRNVCQIIGYALGFAAQRYDIELHEFVVLSNHDHIVATDPNGQRPQFIGLFHSLVARAVNCLFGEVDSLWSGRRHSAPRLLDTDDILSKCVYTLLNPVAAHLVRYAWDWQGISSYALEYDVPVVFERPDFFFSESMPKTTTVILRRPKDLRPELNARELRRQIRAEVKERQGKIAQQARREGKTFLGMQRVLRQPRTNTPYTRDIRNGIRPHIASSSKWARIEALQNLKLFWTLHRTAMRGEQEGRSVVYPFGSFRAKLLGRPCAQAP